MNERRCFSNVTNNYLCRFYEILDNMIEEMTGAKLTDSLSHNFIVQMIPHHMVAIEMSRNILRYTACLPLQDIAQGIITEQTKSIEDMRAILPQCSCLVNSPQDVCMYQSRFGQISGTMFARMRDACADNDINADFMREMIPHHKGAIQMSENLLQYDICCGLIPILDAIIVSQRRGVREMEGLLRGM